jgi:hypothetical protein
MKDVKRTAPRPAAPANPLPKVDEARTLSSWYMKYRIVKHYKWPGGYRLQKWYIWFPICWMENSTIFPSEKAGLNYIAQLKRKL